MKILVTGSNGQLGNELRVLLEAMRPGITDYADIDTLDLTDRTAVDARIDNGGYTHIINCAAYTAVDRAEEDKSLCTAINVDAVKNLGRAAARNEVKLVHVSTDYVFDGTAHRPYRESDKPAPASHYGDTKRKGETALLGLLPDAVIVRTGWLYSSFGHNFVKTILGRIKEGKKLRVVSDQIGTPTYAADLARAIATIVMAKQWLPGFYHFSNEGVASWYDFAKAIAELSGHPEAEIAPVPSSEYVTAATRPLYSVLDKNKIKVTYGLQIPYWRDGLSRCLKALNNND